MLSEAEPVPPCRSGASVTPFLTQSAPVPCGPSNPFVPRHGQHGASPFSRFQRHMPCRLRRVHQKQHAPPTAHRAGRGDILLKPQDVGHVRHRDQPRPRGQRSLDLLRMNATVRVRRHKRERDDAASRQFRKRAQNGIVLHQCGNHVVARMHRAVNRHIERVSACFAQKRRGLRPPRPASRRYAACIFR